MLKAQDAQQLYFLALRVLTSATIDEHGHQMVYIKSIIQREAYNKRDNIYTAPNPLTKKEGNRQDDCPLVALAQPA